MKIRSWGPLILVTCLAGCGNLGQTSDVEVGHGEVLAKKGKGFVWGPAAPEAPIMPSPEPQMPEQPNSPMSPGDGRNATEPLIPSTANPAAPK